ncbi:MAG TPA: sigma-70 family RNA polymerase sigma factor [Oscillospiraceae bacterium]|nr:sigma-70 family RNA polymerase sigma factor [Oscillospiraceae bacterium]
MKSTRYRKDAQTQAALERYAGCMAETNAASLSRLRSNLKRALSEEVTPRQREILMRYYYNGERQTEIAKALGINKSTVCRTLQRGEARLRRCLRYGAARLLQG